MSWNCCLSVWNEATLLTEPGFCMFMHTSRTPSRRGACSEQESFLLRVKGRFSLSKPTCSFLCGYSCKTWIGMPLIPKVGMFYSQPENIMFPRWEFQKVLHLSRQSIETPINKGFCDIISLPWSLPSSLPYYSLLSHYYYKVLQKWTGEVMGGSWERWREGLKWQLSFV